MAVAGIAHLDANTHTHTHTHTRNICLIILVTSVWRKKREDRQCTVRNNETRSCNHCCSGKTMSIAYSECEFVVSYPAYNEHAPYCHLWRVRLYYIYPHNFIKGTIFCKRSLNIKCVLIFSTTLSWTLRIVRIIQRDIIINVERSSHKVHVILVRFYEIWIFSKDVR